MLNASIFFGIIFVVYIILAYVIFPIVIFYIKIKDISVRYKEFINILTIVILLLFVFLVGSQYNFNSYYSTVSNDVIEEEAKKTTLSTDEEIYKINVNIDKKIEEDRQEEIRKSVLYKREELKEMLK